MECFLLLIGVATAAGFIAVIAFKWNLRRAIHQFHAEAVKSLIAEEAALDVLAKEITALAAAIDWIWDRNRRLLGSPSAPRAIPTEPDQPAVHHPGSGHSSGGGAGAKPAHQP